MYMHIHKYGVKQTVLVFLRKDPPFSVMNLNAKCAPPLTDRGVSYQTQPNNQAAIIRFYDDKKQAIPI